MMTTQTSPMPVNAFVQPAPANRMAGSAPMAQLPIAAFAPYQHHFVHHPAPPPQPSSSSAANVRSNSLATQTSFNSFSHNPSAIASTSASSAYTGDDREPVNGKSSKRAAPPSSKGASKAQGAKKKKKASSSNALADDEFAVPTSTKRKMTPMSAFRASDPQTSTASAKKKAEKFKRNSRACTYCQRLKMKCSGPTADGPCERCRRTGRECLVQERAPRRPWTKKKDMQIQQLTDRLEEMEAMLRTSLTTTKDDEDAAELKERAAAAGLLPGTAVATTGAIKSTPSLAPPAHTGPSPNAIANWLTLTNAPTTPSAAHELDLAYVDAHREQLPFVASGKISPEEAVEMFHLFMNSCVLHTVILDIEWHTIPRVGDASPFLFSVILYIAATYHRERRSLRGELQDEMNILIGQAITSGPKSIEVVQGFLLLYQWNSPSADPADDRAWLLSGVALRLASEMQLHRAQKRLVASHTTVPRESKLNGTAMLHTETDRERINRERCWLMAFNVDRSLSFAVGRSWTISEKAPLVRDSDRWYKQKISRPWDQGICAFADLLKTTSRQADVLHTAVSKWDGSASSSDTEGEHDDDEEEHFDCDTMMRIMNDELDTWRRRWLSKDFFALTAEISVEAATAASAAASDRLQAASSSAAATHQDDGSCSSASSVTVHTDALDVHLRTLYYITKQAFFRFNFAVLVLNSFGLQYCATRPKLVHARTYCVTHAVRAAQGLVRAATDGIGATMTYAPHTQFTILSFGVVSLIKLASMVDEVIAGRLIEQVHGCVRFLESIAIASDHTPARLASLVRAMLRKREQQGQQHTGNFAAAGKAKSNGRKETTKSAATQKVLNGTVRSEDVEMERKPKFAPGMELHNLPQRSSRAVTPEHRAFSSAPTTTAGDITADMFGIGVETQEAIPPPSEALGGGVSNTAFAWPTTDDIIPSLTFDQDVEATLQSLGLASNIGTAGWSHMSAEEILDDSFWLRLPDRQSAGNGALGNL